MTSRLNQEKLQQTKRRLAAVRFLTNISLDGSYKDSGWTLEYTKQQEALKTSDTGIQNTGGEPSLVVGTSGTELAGSNHGIDHQVPGPSSRVSGHFRRTSTGNDWEYPDDNPHSEYLTNLIRTRAYTVHNEPKYTHRAVSRQDSSGQSRHAHFSSSESVEHPVPKGPHLSNTNVSEASSTEAEVKYVPMCDVENSLFVKRERLLMLLSKRSIVFIFSVLPYTRNTHISRAPGTERPVDSGLRRRNTSGSRPIPLLVSDSPIDPLEQLIQRTKEEVSYGYLLRSYSGKSRQGSLESNVILEDTDLAGRLHTGRSNEPGIKFQEGNGNISPSDSESQDLRRFLNQHSTASAAVNRGGAPCLATYSPHLLDDPEFRAGKHRTLLTFPSYITSVIDYCKPSDMKKELNDKFRDRFPQIELTLSKLKSLKREMRKVVRTECNIDLLTVAQAFVYFEKLILGSFVTKYNRKFCAGACILLSAKLNDVKGSNLHNLLEIIERTFCIRVSRKDLLVFEFAVLVALEFTLHLPTWEVFPHYQRLLYES